MECQRPINGSVAQINFIPEVSSLDLDAPVGDGAAERLVQEDGFPEKKNSASVAHLPILYRLLDSSDPVSLVLGFPG